jgi:hypothetical protein
MKKTTAIVGVVSLGLLMGAQVAQALAEARQLGCASLRAIAMAGMSEGIVALRAAGFAEIEPFTEVPESWQPVVFLRAMLA